MTEGGETGRVSLIVNPTAGRGTGERSVGLVEAALGADGSQRSLDVHIPGSVAETKEILEVVLEANPERVLVAGGDGMVHLAAQFLAGTHVPMGILPVGTGNDFAAAVGLPADLESAAAACMRTALPVDLIRVGDKWATTVVTFGFSALVNERAEQMRYPRGSSRYTVATLLELPRLQARDVEITVDGVTQEFRAVMVAIANTSRFGGGMEIAPSASHTDGLLDLVVIGDVSRSTLLRVLPRTFSGHHVEHDAVTEMRGSVIEVAGAQQSVRADGEAVSDVPFTASAAPRSLLVAGAR